eukprot:TRINITY_DN65982_c1_g1_i1.p1 TRINITY_DN65982_c1_g1~~TRINITY_DN65982_c1_g1_i1.p1  ORF type:complete len:338 (+),score=181.53 TRINITY_DN65982_c1_g1_i1:135-1016(+)
MSMMNNSMLPQQQQQQQQQRPVVVVASAAAQMQHMQGVGTVDLPDNDKVMRRKKRSKTLCSQSMLLLFQSTLEMMQQNANDLQSKWKSLYLPAQDVEGHTIPLGLLTNHGGYPVSSRHKKMIVRHARACHSTLQELRVAENTLSHYLEDIIDRFQPGLDESDSESEVEEEEHGGQKRRQAVSLSEKQDILMCYKLRVQRAYPPHDQPTRADTAALADFRKAHRDVIRTLIGNCFSQLQGGDPASVKAHIKRIDDKLKDLSTMDPTKFRHRKRKGSSDDGSNKRLKPNDYHDAQ